MTISPPHPESRPLTLTQLGRTRTDEFAWMKDEAWQDLFRNPSVLRPDIRAHLEAENAYCAEVLRETEPLQAQLVSEMRARIQEDDASIPTVDGPYAYASRYRTGGQHPIFVRHALATPAVEEVLLDADALAAASAYFDLATVEHSADHQSLVYATDLQGSEYYEIFVRNLVSGETKTTGVTSSTGDFVISPDSQWLFWVHRNENGRSSHIYRRALQAGPGTDVLVYDEADEGMFLGLDVTQSRAYLTLTASNHDLTEVRLIPAATPCAPPQLIEARRSGLRYQVEHWPTEGQPDRLVIINNGDGAVDFKISTVSASAPEAANWRDLVPHTPGRYIVAAAPLRDYLIRLERYEANSQIVVRPSVGPESLIAFDEPAYTASFETGYRFDATTIRIVYHSPTTPRTWSEVDLISGARRHLKTQAVPSGHDPAQYETQRLYATAPDGAQVPITLLMQRGQTREGPAPLLLYGYGAYGISIDPGFSIRALSLVDRGVIYAIAHVRGGAEKGWGWFLQGRGAAKPNTFTDFIACAETLIEAQFTTKGQIVAMGGSAGGMLIGAVANLRPDLFAGLVAQVPFVDVLNTMSDASLPLTPPEWPEWGDPLTSESAYDLIAGYAPYENVAARPYPPILATGGLSDPRVTYWEPAKWIARLRARSTSGSPALLKINMDAGHAGASGRFDSLKETALDYAFALWALRRARNVPTET